MMQGCNRNLLVLMIVQIFGAKVFACGPDLYPCSLYYSDPNAVFPMFQWEVELREAIAQGRGSAPFSAKLLPSGTNRNDEITNADREDLLEVYSGNTDKVRKVLSAIDSYRSKSPLPDGASIWKTLKFKIAKIFGGKSDVHLQEIPDEFSLYLKGVSNLHVSPSAAVDEWEKLLGLPSKDRKYRSTWAAYMIGNVQAQRGNVVEATRRYEQVRTLVKEGFKDSLGLAAASFVRQSKLRVDKKQSLVGAVERFNSSANAVVAGYYMDPNQLRSSYHSALGELASTSLNPTATSPVFDDATAGIVTGFLISEQISELNVYEKQVAKWLGSINDQSLKFVPGAEKIAWSALKSGEYETAKKWIGFADAKKALTMFVSSKIALRNGETIRAQSLALEARDFGKNEQLYKSNFPLWTNISLWAAYSAIARKSYQDALEYFLESRLWMESAYVAEFVLNPSELDAFLTNSSDRIAKSIEGMILVEKDATNASPRKDSYSLSGDDRPNHIEFIPRLKFLAARRFTRIGDIERAKKYFHDVDMKNVLEDEAMFSESDDKKPQKLSAVFEEYARLKSRIDEAPTSDSRSSMMWDLASYMRHKGLTLMGTELSPDGKVYFEANYPFDPIDRSKLSRSKQPFSYPPNEDELLRVKASFPKINERFHYRYLAAEIAIEGAKLLPINSTIGCERLGIAGRWIKNKSADYLANIRKTARQQCKSEKASAAFQKGWG